MDTDERGLEFTEDGGREVAFEEVAEEGFGVERCAGEGLGTAEGDGQRKGGRLRKTEGAGKFGVAGIRRRFRFVFHAQR